MACSPEMGRDAGEILPANERLRPPRYHPIRFAFAAAPTAYGSRALATLGRREPSFDVSDIITGKIAAADTSDVADSRLDEPGGICSSAGPSPRDVW